MDKPILFISLLVIMLLMLASVLVGVSNIGFSDLFSLFSSSETAHILQASRIPRTLSLALAGAGMAVSGLIMQLIVRNRFVEPSTAGTVESAALGLLIVSILAPGLPIFAKMSAAALCALLGSFLFLAIIARVPLRNPIFVPLVGLMLGGVISSITTFIAYRYDLIQSLLAWTMGDFSGVLRGRYELLWLTLGTSLLGYIFAARFTVASLGWEFATNLGLNHRFIVVLGLVIISISTGTIVASVGIIPFLGLIVPNIVRQLVGDNAKRALPFVAVGGAAFVMLCDIIGRLVRFPFEVPVSTIAGVLGSVIFLYMLLHPRASHG